MRTAASPGVSLISVIPVRLVLVAALSLAACYVLLNQTGTKSLPEPPSSEDTRFEPIGGGVSLSKKFMSRQEVLYLRSLIDGKLGGWHASPTGGEAFAAPRITEVRHLIMQKDPVIRRLEQRIASATGIPIHSDEDMVSFARIRNRAKSSARGGFFLPFGLHLETDTRPHRSKTVLIFLHPPREGGRTVFPLLTPLNSTGKLPPEQQLQRESLVKQLATQFGGPPEYARHAATPPAESKHPLMDLLEDACRGTFGLSVEPEAGAALMWSHLIDESDDWDQTRWHDGCNVIQGTKIILQKFKEVPRKERSLPDPPWVKYNPQYPAGSEPDL